MKSEVYNQSTCLVYAAAYDYYFKKMTNAQIAQKLAVSPSTVSRLLSRAAAEKIISFQMDETALTCIRLAETIKTQFGLADVIVVPLVKGDAEGTKKQVALEGARYLQRIISDDDNIGLAWGGTMYHLIQYLNPCRKKPARIVTLHGNIAACDARFDVETLVRRAAMAFGGGRVSLGQPGLMTVKQMAYFKAAGFDEQIAAIFDTIDISISGVGAFYPKVTSPFAALLTDEERAEAKRHHAVCDFMLRLIDQNGRECDTSLKERTYAISLSAYQKIPLKIVVAEGAAKACAVKALLAGNLVDALIIDADMAKTIVTT